MVDWHERRDIHVGDVFLHDSPNFRAAMVVTMVDHDYDKVYFMCSDGSIGPTFKEDVLQYKKLRRPCRHIKKALKMIRKVEEKNALR